MKVYDYLNAKLVFFLDVESKDDALTQIVDKTVAGINLPEGERFKKAIFDREKIVSTGIGMGVAIPHAKLTAYDDFFISVAILKTGIEWNALDGTPVRLIFLIGGPDDKQTEYLKILSSLTGVLRDEELRKNLIGASSGKEVMSLFELL
ncbi:MAG: PTS sugar transporter subunit IIA [Verrucomicrobia bacterium]|nr:PTS sugar transporter subunit IIA [Verrucomicrobiota bacterium]MBS0636296.1 PTS sugar transporter subunit IIA [Verrucomicrobiota bacterium]